MPKSPSRRRGTIEARGAERWLVRVTVGSDPLTGHPVRVTQTVHGSRKEAERALTGLLRKSDEGAPLPRSRLTLGAWLDEYEATWAGALGAQTRENARQALGTYLTPALRDTPLRSLAPETLQALYNDLTARGRAPATVGFLHRVLSSRLNKALELGHLARNPAKLTTPPAIPRREHRVLSPAEASVFLEECDKDDYGALWILLLLTGLRPEEALGLRRPDLVDGKLTVRRALVRLAKGAWQLDETKTRKPRTVTLPASALRALQRHLSRQAERQIAAGAEYASHDLIFASTLGEPLWWANLVTRHFRPLRKRVACRLADVKDGKRALELTGLARMRPYDLRHSAATLLLAAGEHPKVVAELLGHSKITLTLDTYSHVVPGMLDAAARRMEQIVSKSLTLTRGGVA
ncbi:MAG TPA: site-specific integrase [Gemmatimonadales bacterium]|nr:site-specific integrase [Gemmatimonadales bacterium]